MKKILFVVALTAMSCAAFGQTVVVGASSALMTFSPQSFPGTGSSGSGQSHTFFPGSPIVITRLDVNASTAPTLCSTWPVVTVYVNSTPSSCSYTYTTGVFSSSVSCSVPVTAGQSVSVKLQTAESGCTGTLGTVWPVVQYKMP